MQAQLQPRKVVVNGAELHYIEQGQGDPLLLVHGSLGDFRSWRNQIEPFSQRYRVIAYSRRFHHPNTWPANSSEYTAPQHARDLAALITSLELERFHIVASSYGAFTTLRFASQHLDGIRSLVIAEPPILLWLLETIPDGRPVAEAFLNNAHGPAGRAFLEGNMEEGVRRFLDGVLGQGAFEQFPPPARAALLDNAREMSLETATPLERYFGQFTCEDAGHITVPTLLLTGELSPHMFQLITDELERCLPTSERASIPAASHAMHLGNPQVYNETVLAFLADH